MAIPAWRPSSDAFRPHGILVPMDLVFVCGDSRDTRSQTEVDFGNRSVITLSVAIATGSFHGCRMLSSDLTPLAAYRLSSAISDGRVDLGITVGTRTCCRSTLVGFHVYCTCNDRWRVSSPGKIRSCQVSVS